MRCRELTSYLRPRLYERSHIMQRRSLGLLSDALQVPEAPGSLPSTAHAPTQARKHILTTGHACQHLHLGCNAGLPGAGSWGRCHGPLLRGGQGGWRAGRRLPVVRPEGPGKRPWHAAALLKLLLLLPPLLIRVSC